MEYQGFKSQALDFNVYSDGIDVIAVTPQYALTRENNGTEYYSTKDHPDKGTPGVWTDLTGALADTSDAWWADAKFETLLTEYWNKDNAYSNTLWTREKTQYSNNTVTYSIPREDAGGSAISQWCLENDRTLINGAHIATGTVTAQQIDTGLLNAAGVVVTSPGSSDPKLDTVLLAPTKSEAQTLDVYTIIQKMPASGTIVDKVVDSSEPAGKVYKYDMTLKDRHGGLRLDLTKLSYNQIYTLKFKFIDLCNATVGATPVTRLGGNTGWPVANFSLLKATIDDSPVTDPFTDPPSTDPSIYSTTGYALTKEAGRTYDIELEFIYLGMNNPGGIDSADNYFYISPNRYFDWSDPEAAYTTYTQIQITDKGISSRPLPEFVPQYILIEQGAYITPTQTDSRWQNEFPDWNGQGSVWYRTVTSTVVKADTLGADDTTIYNYSPPQLLTAGESAKLAAAKAEQAVGDWCQAHNVTILDGSNLMTGTIDAAEVKVTNLDASQITAGMFTVGVDGDDENKTLDEHEIIFQAGYTEGENGAKAPLVKIGGFYVDADSIASGDDTKKVGITLTSTDGKNKDAKVIQAGTNFSVDAEGKIVSTGGKIGGLDISTRKLTGRLYNDPSNSAKGVELGITTANHMLSLTLTPPTPNDYLEGAADELLVDIDRSDFGYESQVTTTTSNGTTIQTTKALNWTLSWTSEEQSSGTYIYKSFRPISDKNVDISKSFEKINEDGVSITQINGNNISADLNYEPIYSFDPDSPEDPTKAWIAGYWVTGWEEPGREYAAKTSNSNDEYDSSIQVSPAIRFAVSGDSTKLTISTGYLFTTSAAPSEDLKITNIYTGGELIKTLQPAKSVKATAIVATAGFWTATATVSSGRLLWLTSATSEFFIKRGTSFSQPCDAKAGSGNLEGYQTGWVLGTSGIKLASSWVSTPYPSTTSTNYDITLTITYTNIPHSKPALTTNFTYNLTDTATANNYALYIGAPYTSTAAATYEKAPFRVKHDGTLELTKEISITNTGEVLNDTWLSDTSRGYFNRMTPGRLSVESQYYDGGAGQTGDNWTTYSQLGAIDVRNYTSSNLDVNNFMNSSSVPILASEIKNTSPASFVIAANTNAVHDWHPHHGQVYIQGIVRPSYEGEDSSASLTIGKRTNYRDWLSSAVKEDRSIKITPAEIITNGGTATLSGTWKAAACLATNSDANLKHEIEGLPNNYTSLFDNLKPIRFKYNDGTSNRYHVGFIAQDVEQAILNSGLTTNDVAGYIKEADILTDNGAVVKEGTRSIRYEEFIALNTDQIQKLKSRVAELETTVEELTKLINEKLN